MNRKAGIVARTGAGMAKVGKSGKSSGSAETVAALERLACLLRATQHTEGLNPTQWTALRYLARANRFSNTVSGLAKYLGTTRGTVSQSLKALEKKGLIVSARRVGDGRASDIVLTDSGRATLARDPLLRMEQSFGHLGGRARKRLARGTARFLRAEAERLDVPRFGACLYCANFRESNADSAAAYCRALQQELTAADIGRICVFYQKRSG
jgi:DNA-binding MarR family transcriptional regulator